MVSTTHRNLCHSIFHYNLCVIVQITYVYLHHGRYCHVYFKLFTDWVYTIKCSSKHLQQACLFLFLKSVFSVIMYTKSWHNFSLNIDISVRFLEDLWCDLHANFERDFVDYEYYHRLRWLISQLWNTCTFTRLYGIVLIDTMVNYLGNVSVLSSYTDHSDSKSMHVD